MFRANVSEKIREAKLRWLGHVERKTEEDILMRTWKMEVVDMDGLRKIGRPKLRWSDYKKRHEGVKIEEVQDRGMWRLKTRCTDAK